MAAFAFLFLKTLACNLNSGEMLSSSEMEGCQSQTYHLHKLSCSCYLSIGH